MIPMPWPKLGIGIGWRPALARAIELRRDLSFVEVMVEGIDPNSPPEALVALRARGVQIIPHSVSLSLGGTEPIDPRHLDRLARTAEVFDSPFVSDHIAFVRAGELEVGHLLPLPRTHAALEVLVENIRVAQAALPVPLVVENIASLFEWPGAELDEPAFLTAAIEQSDAGLLLDLENVFANSINHGFDALEFLDQLPLRRVVYVHVAGGVLRDGIYHDSHAHAVDPAVLDLVAELAARTDVPGVMLERDDHFPARAELDAELDAIAHAVALGSQRRTGLE